MGTRGGEETHTLVAQELPTHSHVPMASAAAVNQPNPVNNFWGTGATNPQYSTASISTQMGGGMIGNNSGGQPHENRAPYNVLNFCIALQGIFPSQN
jgi:microcystin-dependent protein